MNMALGAMIAFVSGGAAGFLVSFIPRPRLSTFRHEHAWGLWEDCDISDWEWVSGKKTRILRPGQKRDCFGCGEREVRTVTTKGAS
jgi:hypothetical protein